MAPAKPMAHLTHESLLTLPAFACNIALLIDMDVFLMFSPGRELLGVAVAVACLAAAHGGGYLILQKRDRIRRGAVLSAGRLLPEGQRLDDGLGFCDADLQREFLEATRTPRLAHDVYSAVCGGLFPMKDLLLWQQGRHPSGLPGWVWVAAASVINTTHIYRIFTPLRGPLAEKILVAMTILGHGFGFGSSIIWRLPEFTSGWALFLLALMYATLLSSFLPFGGSESWKPLAASACCSVAGLCISCFMNWHKGMPWAAWLDPRCPPEAILVPMFVLPMFLGVCLASTARMWVQSLALRRFAASEHGHEA